jgi:integrase
MAKKVNFTKKVIDGLPWSKTAVTFYGDEKLRYHRIVISPNGHKTFQVYMKHKGKPVKRKIGNYPEISPEKARQLAKDIIGELNVGIDRQDEKVKKRNEPTYADIWKDYYKFLVDKANQKPKTAAKNIAQYDSIYKVCEQFHELQLSEITTEKLIKFHRWYSIDHGKKIAANNILRQIRACFNYANVENNPASSKKIKLNKQSKRRKYMKTDELQSFVNAALQDESRDYRDVFLLCLFTAARVGSVMSMEWNDVKFKYGVWETITKSSDDKNDITSIGLVDQALSILVSRNKLNTEKSKWVFPATSKSGHVSQPQKAFNRILKRAGLDGFTPHDLRRTAASHLGQSGASNQELLALLGNKSIETLGTYVHNDIKIVKNQYNVVLDRMLDGIKII